MRYTAVTNKIISDLSGEDSENEVKKAFEKLREQGLIEPVDPNASRFKFKYMKTAHALARLPELICRSGRCK